MKVSALLSTLLLLAPLARGEEIIIAAASDLQFAMDAVISEFSAVEADALVKVVYGSSGNFNAQITQGAPFDLYFSADISYPEALHAKGFAASTPVPYATGRLVLWSTAEDIRALDWTALADARFRRIAIANPRHAPYGERAEELLRTVGVLEQVRSRLVFGDNISQTAQFVQTGAADVGIVALSLVLAPALRDSGWYQLVPEELHAPLVQGYIVTRHAQDKPLAWRFASFMASPAAQAILAAYGFALPDSEADAVSAN
jgi:molybdate transport system substrate-binding protein